MLLVDSNLILNAFLRHSLACSFHDETDEIFTTNVDQLRRLGDFLQCLMIEMEMNSLLRACLLSTTSSGTESNSLRNVLTAPSKLPLVVIW